MIAWIVALGVSAGAAAGEPVLAAAVAGANLQRPSWSPDGSRLAFEANYHERKAVETYLLGPGDAPERIAPPARPTSALTTGFTSARPAGAVVHELSWSPAAMGRFAYTASGADSDYDVTIGGAGTVAGSPGADGGPAWSPDGRWIAFTSSRSGEGDLYLIDVHAVERAPRRLTWARSSSELYAAWSPDAARLAFVGHTDAGDNVWWLPSLDASPETLTTWSGSQIRPTWSPDGRWLAFYANHEDPDRFDLLVLAPGSPAAPRLLARGVIPDASGPAWSPDGAHLVYVADDDEAFDPIVALAFATGASSPLDLGTVGHGDLDLTAKDGETWLAWVAQGGRDDPVRDFKKLYTARVALP